MSERNIPQQHIPEDLVAESVTAGGESSSRPKKDEVQLSPDEIAHLQRLARGPQTVRYSGPLVRSSLEIEVDIAGSGIRDPQIIW